MYQKFTFLMVLCFLLVANLMHAQNDPKVILGDWSGTLEVQTVKLTAVFHIKTDKKGVLSATFDSPDQQAFDIAADKIEYANYHLKIVVQKIAGKFEGDFKPESNTIVGNLYQGVSAMPLTLTKQDKPLAKTQHPQEPKPPFPYTSKEVTFTNTKANVTLAGTLTLPKGKGQFPVVVLVSGSGAQDRDETLLGHKPFWVIADDFARKGIAVLRYDDRGVGKSTGSFSQSTSADFADDALAAVEFLKQQKKINPKKIGIAGHSEGGTIAPMVAVKSPDVAFIILMAGTGIDGAEILKIQSKLIQEAEGTPPNEIQESLDIQAKCLGLVQKQKDLTLLKQEMTALLEEYASTLPLDEQTDYSSQNIQQIVNTYCSPWFAYFINYDPQTTLEKVKCPVLAVNGEKDLQVPYKENLEAIDKALKKGGNTHYKTQSFPNLNHLFQTTQTGKPSEYAKIEETFNVKVLETMSQWILSL